MEVTLWKFVVVMIIIGSTLSCQTSKHEQQESTTKQRINRNRHPSKAKQRFKSKTRHQQESKATNSNQQQSISRSTINSNPNVKPSCRKKFKYRSHDYIVGGSLIQHRYKYKFLAALSTQFLQSEGENGTKHIMCSATVISKKWLISAAHCFNKDGSTISVNNCLEAGYCKLNKHGDLEYYPNPGMLTISLGMRNFERDFNRADNYDSKKVVLPTEVYRGEGYGSYGGYDMALIKASEELLTAKPICLPLARYPDSDITAIIAGFGFNSRHTCEVNSQGPSKFRYCGIEPDCWSQSHRKVRHRRCEVNFPYKGENYVGCQKSVPHPGHQNEECRKFYEKMGSQFFCDNSEVDEFKIFHHSSLDPITTCYSPDHHKRYGWCGVNLADSFKQDVKYDINPNKGWGFCTKLCDPDKQSEDIYGVAYDKTIHVLQQKYCHEQMMVKVKQQTGSSSFEVTPKVLCGAKKHFLKTKIFLKDNYDYYKHLKVEESNTTVVENFKDDVSVKYAVGPGSCHGDSGGPLFKSIPDTDGYYGKYVLLGITSRGTGRIGACGGINNFTHYTRITRIRWFIDRYVHHKSMCLVDSKGKIVKKARRMKHRKHRMKH